MSDDGVGYFLVMSMLGCMVILIVVLTGAVIAMIGDGIGLWELANNETCEVAQ